MPQLSYLAKNIFCFLNFFSTPLPLCQLKTSLSPLLKMTKTVYFRFTCLPVCSITIQLSLGMVIWTNIQQKWPPTFIFGPSIFWHRQSGLKWESKQIKKWILHWGHSNNSNKFELEWSFERTFNKNDRPLSFFDRPFSQKSQMNTKKLI